ncbi:hypothetical protein UFOVP410_115 [uncultured Caudovirales phage]|uniref:Lipoprotein n=1 Tax=uncultured Caudovirales phage TaxID=2100421 RepID=A0A6J5M862_9CAUD|nr:hypothetical protein UFOVP410_115 [uncultured Caudovirales phage]
MEKIKAIITVLTIFAILTLVAAISGCSTNKNISLGKIVLHEVSCSDINVCNTKIKLFCEDKVEIVKQTKHITIQYYCENHHGNR